MRSVTHSSSARRWLVLTAVATAMAIGAAAQAQLTVAELEPEADTWVGFFSGGDFGNRNGDANLEAQGDFGSDARQGRVLARFDLSSLSGTAVTSATLTIRRGSYYNLTGSPAEAPVEVRHIVPGNAWTEGGATWQTVDGSTAWTQTGVGGPTGGPVPGTGNFVSDTVYDSFQTPEAAGNNQPLPTPIDLDVTALVQQWVSGQLENNGLALQLANGFDANSFLIIVPNSEQAAAGESLLLTIVPEPATLGLLLVGLGVVARRRR